LGWLGEKTTDKKNHTENRKDFKLFHLLSPFQRKAFTIAGFK
jgi:hypothetical protein